jgi:hypothetical protein
MSRQLHLSAYMQQPELIVPSDNGGRIVYPLLQSTSDEEELLEMRSMRTLAGLTSKRNINDRLLKSDEKCSGFAEELACTGSWIESNSPPRPRWEEEDDDLLFATDQSSAHCVCQSYQYQSCLNHHPHASVSTQSSVDDALLQIRQPETRPISQEQLVAEVKGIYAGLVMVESKCIEVDKNNNWEASNGPAKLSDEQWQALISLHGTLLHEVHHPSVRHTVNRSSSRHGIPTRMWRNEVRSFLKLLRYRVPFSLKYLISLFDVASSVLDSLYHAQISVDMIQGEILEWLQKIELVFNRLIKLFRHIFSQFLIYVITFFCLFSEFPNGMRHLCTTMPWTIWPALVVLWGVCWMFYPGPLDQQVQTLDVQGKYR